MQRLTLRSPLGMAFRAFAFSTIACALSSYRAASYSWSRPDPVLTFIAHEIALESGALRITHSFGDAFRPTQAALLARRNHSGFSIRIPEPLGYQDGIARAMFTVRRQSLSSPQLAARSSRLTIPLWPLTLLTLLPALRFAKHKYHERVTRRRLRRGCCVECGYDLCATPARCPECGAVPMETSFAISLPHSHAA